MIKRYEFIERILFLIRRELDNLPSEATLDEMYFEFEKRILKLLNKEVK